ncbi:thioredoxin family protein [Cupriavidus respiraculi]|uniref:thioredoxin fold domain-containing protein n=1 Tax=Cupriavidus respiraculi TaxID=195930 RepID=UPI001C93FDC3|nr:thioredoxin fold domain-containing protein [Cupriavidus respiraculi]MBY4946176.1 thioredoxin family protein [Cupriavidus respiraculi]
MPLPALRAVPFVHLRARFRSGACAAALLGIAAIATTAPCTASAATAGVAHLPSVTDLAADTAAAARRGEPLVVLVSLPDCKYCDAVRRSYLSPQAAAGEIVARELDMSAATPLRDADGRMTTARDWARARNVRVAPTVMFLDARGRPVAAPLLGMQPDFYGAYLEQALDQARAAIAAAR